MTTPLRPRNDWGEGDLPAPWAEGDTVYVHEGAACLVGIDGHGPRVHRAPGLYAVSFATSIGEGDEWYFRLLRPGDVRSSDRLHVIYDRTEEPDWRNDVDWMAGVDRLTTLDPDGLALRERMLAYGWIHAPDEGVS